MEKMRSGVPTEVGRQEAKRDKFHLPLPLILFQPSVDDGTHPHWGMNPCSWVLPFKCSSLGNTGPPRTPTLPETIYNLGVPWPSQVDTYQRNQMVLHYEYSKKYHTKCWGEQRRDWLDGGHRAALQETTEQEGPWRPNGHNHSTVSWLLSERLRLSVVIHWPYKYLCFCTRSGWFLALRIWWKRTETMSCPYGARSTTKERANKVGAVS